MDAHVCVCVCVCVLCMCLRARLSARPCVHARVYTHRFAVTQPVTDNGASVQSDPHESVCVRACVCVCVYSPTHRFAVT